LINAAALPSTDYSIYIPVITMVSSGGAVGMASALDKLTDSTVQYIDNDNKSQSSDLATSLEKGVVVKTTSASVDNESGEITYLLSHEDPFPIDPDEELVTQQFTFRAVVVGCLLGGVIAASRFVFPSLFVKSFADNRAVFTSA
jgi:hypothetical protein